jgi:hypothetical protein
LPIIEIETGEVPGIGFISEANVNRVSASIHGRFERLKIPGGANEFHFWKYSYANPGIFRVLVSLRDTYFPQLASSTMARQCAP